MKLPEDGNQTHEVKDTFAKFICSVYYPRGIWITDIPELGHVGYRVIIDVTICTNFNAVLS